MVNGSYNSGTTQQKHRFLKFLCGFLNHLLTIIDMKLVQHPFRRQCKKAFPVGKALEFQTHEPLKMHPSTKNHRQFCHIW